MPPLRYAMLDIAAYAACAADYAAADAMLMPRAMIFASAYYAMLIFAADLLRFMYAAPPFR